MFQRSDFKFDIKISRKNQKNDNVMAPWLIRRRKERKAGERM
jgi:hypothetical protein